MTYPVWTDAGWSDVEVPQMSGEGLVVPNVAALIRNAAGDAIVLQRRDKPGEPVRGRLEIPGGRWRAGEPPEDAVAREVAEETGLSQLELSGVDRIQLGDHRACGVVRPVAVINGIDGTYPSLHVLFECVAGGTLRPQPGETADPRWWPEAEVVELLDRAPGEFVDQTRAMLTAYFDANR